MKRKNVKIKRLVVKVGSSILVDKKGKLSAARCRRVAAQLAEIQDSGIEVVLVSSGAIAAGLGRLDMTKKPESIALKQAIAAIGQPVLMREYEKAFAKFGKKTAQVLLTREDLASQKRSLNARDAIYEIIKLGVVPIVNENDTVAVDEIKVGDNDNLSALVAQLVDADTLIILSDVDGVYDADPRLVKTAQRLREIKIIDHQLKQGASDSLRIGSTGGMRTKLEAAEKAQNHGIATIIASGQENETILRIVRGEDVGTLILASKH